MGHALKKTTVYLDGDIHRALRIKAADVDRSISDLITQAIRRELEEDGEDLQAFRDRAKEASLPFEVALKKLKALGKL